MRTFAIPIALLAGIACASSRPATDLSAGVDLRGMDPSVSPGQDFYRYANGRWLAQTVIPEDKPAYGTLSELADRTEEQLHGILERIAPAGLHARDPDTRKVGDLYASFMDTAAVESAGLAPLRHELAALAAVRSKAQLPGLIAHYIAIDVTTPYDLGVGPDARDSTRYAVQLEQSGLGLPDRDYYLRKDDAHLAAILRQYQAHIAQMLELAGDERASAQQQAAQIVALETQIAQAQWTKVQLRDPVRTYNKTEIAQLPGLMPGYDWPRFLRAADVSGKVGYVIVGEPSYLQSLAQLLQHTPLPIWKSYFRWHLLSAFAPYLSRAFVDADFAFYGTILRGTPQNTPRWKRGVELVQGAIGEGLGKLYVAQYFPPATRARAQRLVDTLLEAYRQEIRTLDWMGPATKQEAEAKLDLLDKKIGYPSRWRDYSRLVIRRGELLGDVMRASQFEYERQIHKLGRPIDREEWEMTPQTVNAYYRPDLNEIVFPAAILQPPTFDPHADDASNYGAIGAVIGHEMSHGFDDQGSQYDAHGNLRDWWTAQDHERFAARTAALVAQYDRAEPLPGYHVNGRLTLGENIADNSGLAMAYKAYHLALQGRQAPVLDGMSGDQRFFLAFAQIWRGKYRDPYLILLLKSDPHAPAEVRGSYPLRNQPPFYMAFAVKPGERMYLPPAERVILW
ncbi:MAG TPA: M13 family metallopeptidase [Steroidobacteraceae bacterium]|nr:M13 family metallopeptidase [Steroidobacteraceae bacterium]